MAPTTSRELAVTSSQWGDLDLRMRMGERRSHKRLFPLQSTASCVMDPKARRAPKSSWNDLCPPARQHLKQAGDLAYLPECGGVSCAPDDGECYYVLIYMDRSHRLDTRRIDWDHPYEGMVLNSQHHLQQVGRLFEQVLCALSNGLTEIRDLFLSAVEHERTAREILAHPLMKRSSRWAGWFELIAVLITVLDRGSARI